MLLSAIAPSVFADIDVGIYGYVDDVQYAGGDEGQLMIWIVNEGTEAFILQNLTIIFPWNSVIPWEGNVTEADLDEAISIGKNKTFTFDFTIPDDGRALSYSSSIRAYVFVDDELHEAVIPMNIANPPYVMAFDEMNNLITLITVQIVITLLAAIIIAAAIFLSGRAPSHAMTAE
ncbi:MAG: hypothetical protein JSV35_04595 [Candidatus Bathyarchaeota archaeon]|nr:MAG: hypothetical protein JSV35_04595 [Candidatus Bathyarchaeota archaeon]